MRHSVRESPKWRYPASMETHPIKRGWGLRFGRGTSRVEEVADPRWGAKSGNAKTVVKLSTDALSVLLRDLGEPLNKLPDCHCERSEAISSFL
jgi:hypothetical protein